LRFSKRLVTSEERQRLIAAAAYFRAQRREFTAGHAVEDWLMAEREVDDRVVVGGTSSYE
jgi:hypothetical protein